ncbi:MAG: polysaccharide lyase family 8 super-sandwich domain-containing protein [Phycisphaerae bacterium]
MKSVDPTPHLSRAKTVAALVAAVAAAGMSAANPARAADFDTISQRVQSNLLGKAPSTSTVKGYMNSLQPDGSWTDINYASTAQTNWSPLTHVQRMAGMAEVWANPGSSLYHNTTLAADLRASMDYWFSFTANATGAPSGADNFNNPTPYSTNWFDNDIAGPQALGSAMVMATSVFTPDQLSTAQYYLLNAKKELPHFTGQNTVDLSIVGVYSSIASGSTTDMTSAFNSMNGTVFISNFGTDGIQSDHSYHIHGIQLYMGGYGTSYINDMLNWASVSAGTAYALTTDQQHIITDYLLDGTQWFIRGRTMDLTADGRQVTFPSFVGAGGGFVNAIQQAQTLGSYRTADLQNFLNRQNLTNSQNAANSTLYTLSGNRDFYNSEIMVQQRSAYYASVKVVSTRTSQPEQGNGQGLQNLYLGDGVNQIMVTGNEYYGIQPSWNWRRLPGTTVEQDTRSLTPSGSFGAAHGTTDYAGGVSDNTYGLEAFNYNRFDVKAKKSWAFFDNEEVALGAAINSSNTTYEVDTTLNQCLQSSAVSFETTSGTIQTLSNGTSATPANLRWVYQGNVGYFFLTPVSNATIMAVPQSGTWYALNTAASNSTVTQNIFTLYINHGAAVSNGTYAYIAVPGITLANMDSYFAANPIQILRNDANVQAVRNAALDVTEAAFYAPDSFTLPGNQTVTSSGAATIILRRQPNTLSLSASSPQALQQPLSVSLANLTLSGPTPTWLDALGTATATFSLPGGNLAASTVGITLSSNGNATPTVSLSSNDHNTSSSYIVTAPVSLPANTTFQQDNLTTLTFSAPISGNASLTQTGTGTLILSANNSFTGGTFINGGTLRATNSNALPNTTTINPSGTLVITTSLSSPITLAGGTLGFANAPTLTSDLTIAPNTTSTIQSADPQNPNTSINASFTGRLLGAGNLLLKNAGNITNPDGAQAFRINAPNTSTFSGNITLANNVKGELFGQTAGAVSPAGTATLILTAGDAARNNSLNTLTTTTGYSELNLRINSSANQTYTNNLVISGAGLALLNPLGSAPANTSVTLGNLRIGANQELGTYLAASFATHPILFQSVTLTGGIATFSPKTNGFGSASSTGADLTLANISELAPSGINMTGLRTLFLSGNNTYSGPTTVSSGTLVFTANSTSNISTLTATAPITIYGAVRIAPNANPSTLTALTLAGTNNNWTGSLDLTNNTLIINDAATHNTTLATLQNEITYGATHPATGRGGIFSSTLAPNHALALLDNAALGLTTFANQPVDATSLLLTPLLLGDANADNKVDLSDLSTVLNNFGQSTPNWTDGNFDASPTIDLTDLSAILNNFGLTTPSASSQLPITTNQLPTTPTPEPASLTLLLPVLLFTSRSRRHRLA